MLAACQTVSHSHTESQGYSNPFDPWRACGKEGYEAAKGNPIALHICFLAAYVRQSDPYLGGEDLETIWKTMEDILKKLGDGRFTQALSMERPEVRSAVGGFIDGQTIKAYPKTKQLIGAAPKIDFPLDQTNRDEAHSPLLQKFIQFEQHGTRY
jgi:hypothetical protein